MKTLLRKTTESGTFIRTIVTREGKRKQRTTKMKRNQKKVVIGYLGDFEVYVYPYEYPDSVFIGAFPISVSLDKSNVGMLFHIYNVARWYLSNEWQTKETWRNAPNSRRRAILTAFNLGLSEFIAKNQRPKRL